MEQKFSPNLGMALVRTTEAAALTAGRYMGLNQPDKADHFAAEAMANAFDNVHIEGHMVIGEETKLGTHSHLDSGLIVGAGDGPVMDVVADPVDGTRLLALGHSDAISVVGIAPRGSSPGRSTWAVSSTRIPGRSSIALPCHPSEPPGSPKWATV